MSKQAVKMGVDPEAKSESKSVDLDERVVQQEVAELAFEFWRSRGCPDGSPGDDWFRAERELQSRTIEICPALLIESNKPKGRERGT